MVESGTHTASGQATGLDYLKDLGVTHVQLMPMYDFASIDETSADPSYNWGYDPKNYNVPEGTYSSDANDPTARVLEMKEMVNGYHKAGIRVVMDVVYNHVYSMDEQAFQRSCRVTTSSMIKVATQPAVAGSETTSPVSAGWFASTFWIR